MEKNKMKILVIAAHPDDEVLGMGGTILKHIDQGDEVFVCMMTKGYEPDWTKEFIKNKIVEAEKVDKFLGVKKRFFCGFPTARLNTIPHGEISKGVRNVINEVKPDIIYTHSEKDIHEDHRIIFNSVMVASRPITENKIKIICFEILSSSEWNHKSFCPNYYVDIEKYIEKKIKAFSIYESEVREYPHPRSKKGIEILAKKRGMEVCIPYAESFKIIREFW
ncbi:MAG: PIG-L family deacetylase [Candidatus Nanoarchaeia archaeon]|nr:PIG-L family deacetylase [Candidatus Nanoarchaeia archaeon]